MLAAAVALFAAAMATASAAALAIIPAPLSVTPASGGLDVPAGAVVSVPEGDAAARFAATELVARVAQAGGPRLVIANRKTPNCAPLIVFQRKVGAGEMGPEEYAIDVGPDRVAVSASSDAGLLYGAVSLWQMLTERNSSPERTHLDAVAIQDRPRFPWRGLLLDSARHYQSVAFIERMIDWMALHKLNVLQWHLTDDQAWRLEIRKYPRLTTEGAWRIPAGAAAAIDARTGRPLPYGGVYTQAQVRALVAYAQARNVTIVPEIEMPGHALSAMLAYPQLSASGPAPRNVQGDWGIFPYIYSYDEATFSFLQDVLGEVMALFPSRYIAIGGDEAVKDQWKASPAIQAQIKALGLANEDALQSRFTQRIEGFLEENGRRALGWDDILAGGLPAAAAVTSWHGPDGAVAAVRAGHDVIMATDPILYFDHRQSDLPGEPPGRGIVISLHDVYAFEPAPAALTEQERGHILGLQANLWTEHIRTEDRLQAMAFPRAAAVAEIGWSSPERKDWTSFTARLPAAFRRYRAIGLKADESAFDVRMDVAADQAQRRATVLLSNQLALGQIRYTTDGSSPGPDSPAYAGPVALALPARLRAATFDGAERLSSEVDQRLDGRTTRQRTSQQLTLCTNKLALNLEGGGPAGSERPRYLVDILNPCWIYPGEDLSEVSGLTVGVGRLPFNFQLGADKTRIALHAPYTRDGELEVRIDGCAGDLVASIPLTPATLSTGGVTTLGVAMPPRSGKHDLCFTFASRTLDPLWAIDWVQLDTANAVPSTLALR